VHEYPTYIQAQEDRHLDSRKWASNQNLVSFTRANLGNSISITLYLSYHAIMRQQQTQHSMINASKAFNYSSYQKQT